LLITSQLPLATWHEVIGEPTLGDAILDRIVHNAYRLELDGPSMRKIKAAEASEPTPSPRDNRRSRYQAPQGSKEMKRSASHRPPPCVNRHLPRTPLRASHRDRSEWVIGIAWNG
jgi:hypothetical protein